MIQLQLALCKYDMWWSFIYEYKKSTVFFFFNFFSPLFYLNEALLKLEVDVDGRGSTSTYLIKLKKENKPENHTNINFLKWYYWKNETFSKSGRNIRNSLVYVN